MTKNLQSALKKYRRLARGSAHDGTLVVECTAVHVLEEIKEIAHGPRLRRLSSRVHRNAARPAEAARVGRRMGHRGRSGGVALR